MTKRSYPFEESFFPQRKIYVTEKIVNGGVAQKERMLVVYEKTSKLLFNGANQFQYNENSDNLVNKRKKSLEDLNIITCFGCGKESTPYNGKKELEAPCFVCSCPSQNRCSYCDKMMCGNCELCCYHCNLIFCKNCSFTVFTEEMDYGIVCYSCFK